MPATDAAELHERLRKAIAEVACVPDDNPGDSLSEPGTVYLMILPILHALGWRGAKRICMEYVVKAAGSVDIALLCDGKPAVFVEAKAYSPGGKLDPKAASQVASYATTAGVQWCLLTNGANYQLYNNEWYDQPLEERLVFAANVLTEPAETVSARLSLLECGAVAGGRLAHEARVQYVVRHLEQWFREPSQDVANGIAKLLPAKVPSEAVRAALRGCEVRGARMATVEAVPTPVAPPVDAVPPVDEVGAPEPDPGSDTRIWGAPAYCKPVRVAGGRVYVMRRGWVKGNLQKRSVPAGDLRTALDTVCEISSGGGRFWAHRVADAAWGGHSSAPYDKARIALGLLWLAGVAKVVDETHHQELELTVPPDPDALWDAIMALAEPGAPDGADEPAAATPPRSPFTGRRITGFTLFGQTHNAESWKDMYVRVCEIVRKRCPDDFGQRVREVRGHHCVWFSTNPDELRSAVLIGNGPLYAYGQISAHDAVRRARRVLQHFGYDPNELELITADK